MSRNILSYIRYGKILGKTDKFPQNHLRKTDKINQNNLGKTDETS